MIIFMKGYGEVETKLFGRVKKEQMYLPDSDEWLLKRISPSCENNCGNEFYNIYLSSIPLVIILHLANMQPVFKLVCPNCGETIQLEEEEFTLIKPYIKVNKLLESGKIDDFEYKNRQFKIQSSLLKLKRQ